MYKKRYKIFMGMMNTNIYIFVFMMPINILYFSGDLLCQLYFIGLCNGQDFWVLLKF